MGLQRLAMVMHTLLYTSEPTILFPAGGAVAEPRAPVRDGVVERRYGRQQAGAGDPRGVPRLQGASHPTVLHSVFLKIVRDQPHPVWLVRIGNVFPNHMTFQL